MLYFLLSVSKINDNKNELFLQYSIHDGSCRYYDVMERVTLKLSIIYLSIT